MPLKNTDTQSPTPMMEQYLAIRKSYPNYLLFYRMGDFYELFFDDATEAAAALDITLTKRGKHLGQDIPMCGVPFHAADTYLARLIRKGYRVAICEQVEDPAAARKRGGRSVVRREVVRIVTPGTITEDVLLDAKTNNYLAALVEVNKEFGLAWLDVSTGEFLSTTVTADTIGLELSRVQPSELLVLEELPEEILSTLDTVLYTTTFLSRGSDSLVVAEQRIKKAFGMLTLNTLGNLRPTEIAACGMIIGYVDLTQKGKIPNLQLPKSEAEFSGMLIDAATRRNLELSATLSGDRNGSLLSVIDRTVTSAGARLLRSQIFSPLTKPLAIDARLDSIEFLIAQKGVNRRIKELLVGVPDLERALSRLSLGRGSPRDLASVGVVLGISKAIHAILEGKTLPSAIEGGQVYLDCHSRLLKQLSCALADELPILARDGGCIRQGFSKELDSLRSGSDKARRDIVALQAQYVAITDVSSLKIRHNNVIGYFIEVTNKHAKELTENTSEDVEGKFIHRQTMSNATRFTTIELTELEGEIASSREICINLELEILENLRTVVLENKETLSLTAKTLAELDVASSLAFLADEHGYVRPKLDNSRIFDIKSGRHPVVERALRDKGDKAFIDNNCDLGEESRLWLVTGPNMAGKSTFLRQNALIAILAQAGSYVPAASAHIGVIDQLFSRVGAADDLARGQSTFMIEMVETATILNQSTERSFVILDEIGRGTATYDGLSIAWAAVEYLHETNRCRALFATHYHELTALRAELTCLKNVTMRIKEWKGDVIFLHEVVEGTADRSYGIAVARLAGLPAPVLTRADEVLKKLEGISDGSRSQHLIADLPLFAKNQHTPVASQDSKIFAELAAIDPDSISPNAALSLLYELKRLSKEVSRK